MTSWLTGHISQAEADRLKQLITEDPAVKAAWKDFLAQFPHEDVQTAFSRYDHLGWRPAEDITRGLPARPSRYIGWKRTAIAAVLLGCIAAGWYLFSRQSAPAPGQPMQAAGDQLVNEKNIALQLANGQLINLSQPKDSILLENARLKNANRSLSYTLAGETASAAEATALNSLRVPIGKDYRVTLSDGTEVWLNSATTLQFPFRFTGKAREITITGEAYLKVAPHAAQPFLVHTAHGTVRVLGTAFNINAYYAGTVKVALVEGAVRFTAGGGNVTIEPGKQAVYQVDKGIRLQPYDADEVLAWRQGKYYFSDASLDEIMSVLPRWYGITVVIDNPRLGGERFAGVMDRNKPVTVFLDNLVQTMKISYYFDKEEVLHLR